MEPVFDAQKYLETPERINRFNRMIRDKVLSKPFCCLHLNELKDFPCIDVIRQHNLTHFFGIDEKIYPNLVRVFYTNMEESGSNGSFKTSIAEIPIEITPSLLNRYLRTLRPNSIQACSHRHFRELECISESRVMDYVLQDALVPHSYPHIHILKKVDLSLNMQVFSEFVQSILLPRKGHIDTVNLLDIWVMGALGLGAPLDIGYLICRYMAIARVHPQQSLPYGSLITYILQKQKINVDPAEPIYRIPAKNIISAATFKAKHWECVSGEWRIKPKRQQGEASTSKRPRTEEDAPSIEAEPSSSRSIDEERHNLVMASIGSLADSVQSLRAFVEENAQETSRRLDSLETTLRSFYGDP